MKTQRKHTPYKQFLGFNQARKYVQKLKIKSAKEYWKFSKTKRPSFIPANPPEHYRQWWRSWPHFLGTNRTWNRTKTFWSLEKSMKWLREADIVTSKEFYVARSQGKIPSGIPSHPEIYYNKLRSTTKTGKQRKQNKK